MESTATRRRRISFSTGASQAMWAAFLEMANARLYQSWGSLTEALKTGRNRNEAKQRGDWMAHLWLAGSHAAGLPTVVAAGK